MPEDKKVCTGTSKLCPELMAEVCRALNFDPEEFAKRHAGEFVHMYLRADQMLSGVGEEIVSYLSRRVNECLSKAEYALLSYIEYTGRGNLEDESIDFNQAVSNYLAVRRQTGGDWVYAFEGTDTRRQCAEAYPQMYAIAQAMYAFALETEAFPEISNTSGPKAWPDPKKLHR